MSTCGCPTNGAGDIRCHVCLEYVNVRCWRCHTPRGEGTCPRPKTPGFTVPQRANLLWLAVDLDGTLAEPIWTPENPVAAIGDPIKLNVVKLREAVRAGYKPVIHTSRPWSDYEAIEAWLQHHGIPFRSIVCGKILAAAYIDDRGIHESEASWIPAAREGALSWHP